MAFVPPQSDDDSCHSHVGGSVDYLTDCVLGTVETFSAICIWVKVRRVTLSSLLTEVNYLDFTKERNILYCSVQTHTDEGEVLKKD